MVLLVAFLPCRTFQTISCQLKYQDTKTYIRVTVSYDNRVSCQFRAEVNHSHASGYDGIIVFLVLMIYAMLYIN